MPNGVQVVFDYLKSLGVQVVFATPGANEVALLDGTTVAANGVTLVTCLQEGIAVAAAMGYGRATDLPGVALVHLTPGTANSIANLFNADHSRAPILLLCGQQSNELISQEPVLFSDLVQLTSQYAKWSSEVRVADDLPLVLQRALKVAMTDPMGPVVLSIPWEFTLAPVQEAGPPQVTRVATHCAGDPQAVRRAAELLATATNPLIVLGDSKDDAWTELQRLATTIGARVYSEFLSTKMNFPNKDPLWGGEMPGSQLGMQQIFAGHDVVFFCGYNNQAPTIVYNAADGPLIQPSVSQIYLGINPWELAKNFFGEVAILGDIKTTLPPLCDAITADPGYDPAQAAARVQSLRQLGDQNQRDLQSFADAVSNPSGSAPITGANVAIALAALQPEMSAPLTLVNEAISDLAAFQMFPNYDNPKAYFCSQGGALGYSLGAGLGFKAAVGQSRTVVAIVGDGSFMFQVQALYSAARFGLAILIVVTNNLAYRTLEIVLAQVEQLFGFIPNNPATPYFQLTQDPRIDFVGLAAQFGIPGRHVSQLNELSDALREGLTVVAAGQPFVVEVLTDSSVPESQPPRLDDLLTRTDEAGNQLVPPSAVGILLP